MNKKLVTLFSIFFVLCLLGLSIPSTTVYGIPITPTPAPAMPKTGIADGDWQWMAASVHGTEVSVDLASAPAPAWLQLLTSGLKIDAPAKICHPFKGGQYKWIGEIRQLVAGKWVKLDTVNDWVPDKEGQFMSCAAAPAAGTYALFGYYTGPAEKKQVCQYSTADWTAKLIFDEPNLVYAANVSSLPVGTTVQFQVLSVNPAGGVSGAASGSGVVTEDEFTGNHIVYFSDYPVAFTGAQVDPEDPYINVILRISANGCSKDILIKIGIG